jgi:hypothetical protein
MKRCPTCQRTYPDDAPGFCSSDGTRLVSEESPEFDPQKTVLSLPTSPPPQQQANPAPPDNPPQPQSYNPPPAQPAPPPPQQPMWQPSQPPPQAQNYGGGFYPPQGQPPPWPPQYSPQMMKSKGLSLTAFLTGLISGIMGGLLLASYLGAFRLSRDIAYPLLIAAIALGAVSLVMGLISLFSSRQAGKAMAAIGMVLGAFSIGFWIYLEVEHGIFFR